MSSSFTTQYGVPHQHTSPLGLLQCEVHCVITLSLGVGRVFPILAISSLVLIPYLLWLRRWCFWPAFAPVSGQFPWDAVHNASCWVCLVPFCQLESFGLHFFTDAGSPVGTSCFPFTDTCLFLTGGHSVESHFPLHFHYILGGGFDSFFWTLVLWTQLFFSSSSPWTFSQWIIFSVILEPSSLWTWSGEPLCLSSPPTHCWFYCLFQ